MSIGAWFGTPFAISIDVFSSGVKRLYKLTCGINIKRADYATPATVTTPARSSA